MSEILHAKKVIGIFIHLWPLIKTKISRLSQTFTVYICEIESFASRVVRVEGICNQY